MNAVVDFLCSVFFTHTYVIPLIYLFYCMTHNTVDGVCAARHDKRADPGYAQEVQRPGAAQGGNLQALGWYVLLLTSSCLSVF